MRAALALIVTAGVAVGAGFLGFQAGIASNIGAAGGTVVVGGGFHLFGLFLFLPFLFFAFLALAAIFAGRRHRHGPWGMRGGMGPGGFGPGGPASSQGPWADSRRAWIAEVHRSLHADEAGAASDTDRSTGQATGS